MVGRHCVWWTQTEYCRSREDREACVIARICWWRGVYVSRRGDAQHMCFLSLSESLPTVEFGFHPMYNRMRRAILSQFILYYFHCHSNDDIQLWPIVYGDALHITATWQRPDRSLLGRRLATQWPSLLMMGTGGCILGMIWSGEVCHCV